jgi:hypothetical protein
MVWFHAEEVLLGGEAASVRPAVGESCHEAGNRFAGRSGALRRAALSVF